MRRRLKQGWLLASLLTTREDELQKKKRRGKVQLEDLEAAKKALVGQKDLANEVKQVRKFGVP